MNKKDDFTPEFGIDPRAKSNIQRNSKNAPNGIDWNTLINAGLKGPKSHGKTPLGMVNDQQKNTKKRR